MSSSAAKSHQQDGSELQLQFPPVDDPTVSIIIAGWKSAPYLVDCLASLLSQIKSVSYEVIVTLNEPTDEFLESLSRAVVGVRVITSPVNAGYGGACNRGAALARGRFLVLLNDDAIVLEGWLEALFEAAMGDNEAGAVGSRILLEDGTLQEEGAVIWSDGATTLLGYQTRPKSSPDLRLRRVDYCSAASLLVRRDSWEAIGGLDEGFFPAYCEDVDLCLQIAARGLKTLYQPRSTVVHREGSSTAHTYRTFLAERNRQRLRLRWAPALALHQPPDQENPQAIAEAARLGESRPLPLPGPLPLSDDDGGDLSDTDYLAKYADTLVAYTSRLEDDLFAAESFRLNMEAKLAKTEAELDRLHHAVADLRVESAERKEKADEAEAALELIRDRRFYRLSEWLVTTMTSLPVVGPTIRKMIFKDQADQ